MQKSRGGGKLGLTFMLYVGTTLRIYKAKAEERGVSAKAYFSEGTPDSVIKLAKKFSGKITLTLLKKMNDAEKNM